MKHIFLLVFLAGCAQYDWAKSEHIAQVQVHKIETPLAVEFCSALLGGLRNGCAVRMRHAETGQVECVVVILPNDGEIAAHEGGHCMGYDHPRGKK